MLLPNDISWGITSDKFDRTYVIGNIRWIDEHGNKKSTTRCLHSFIMDNGGDRRVVVDHINHDTLDNRRANLRVISNAENVRYRKGKNRNNKSGYRNVFWNTNAGKWCVSLHKDGKQINGGMYDDVHEAGFVAEQLRCEIYGKFAGYN